MKKLILLLLLSLSLNSISQTRVDYTVNLDGSILFEKITPAYQPQYKYWRGELGQAEEEGITCVPYNFTELDYLGFIGTPEDPQMGNGVCFIARNKAGQYIGSLPFNRKDIYLSTFYTKKADGNEIVFTLLDNGDDTTEIIVDCADDGIINHLSFEVKVRQHYEE